VSGEPQGLGVLQKRSQPISRVLSWTIIPLECASPRTSSDLPGSRCEPHFGSSRTHDSPIWSCSRWGLPCRRVLPPTRCALTAPFHPCRRSVRSAWAVYFLLHFPWARAPQALPGTSARGARTFLRFHKENSDCLADSATDYMRPAPAVTSRSVAWRGVRPRRGRGCVRRQRSSAACFRRPAREHRETGLARPLRSRTPRTTYGGIAGEVLSGS
jgi:hypothetical protein